jgi:diaminohydroxyphosphoribosylaminopyrimidine deaminase/5-amino-6-(5-phosphoribosylamino)uracil reductase
MTSMNPVARNDRNFMRRALFLAGKAAGDTSPNPMVGAVLVKNGSIVAENYHRSPGTPHAEALVLEEAGRKAVGSTLYVNLEPCCHTEKRTPPCTKALIEARVKKVLIAMEDPNPKVSGRGKGALLSAGITVDSGILEAEARRLNEAYVKYITRKLPFVILKIAMSLDGKIALPTGESKWITGVKARKMVHRMRSSVDAVVTAIGTVRADNPSFTARIRGGKNPVRIVIDPSLEISDNVKLVNTPPDTLIVTRMNRSRKVENLKKRGIGFIFYRGKLHLQWLMERLGEMGIASVMIEGGSSLASHAFEDRVVDKVAFFIAPRIIGGKTSYPAVGGNSCGILEDAYHLKDIKIRKLGEDLLLEGYVLKN